MRHRPERPAIELAASHTWQSIHIGSRDIISPLQEAKQSVVEISIFTSPFAPLDVVGRRTIRYACRFSKDQLSDTVRSSISEMGDATTASSSKAISTPSTHLEPSAYGRKGKQKWVDSGKTLGAAVNPVGGEIAAWVTPVSLAQPLYNSGLKVVADEIAAPRYEPRHQARRTLRQPVRPDDILRLALLFTRCSAQLLHRDIYPIFVITTHRRFGCPDTNQVQCHQSPDVWHGRGVGQRWRASWNRVAVGSTRAGNSRTYATIGRDVSRGAAASKGD